MDFVFDVAIVAQQSTVTFIFYQKFTQLACVIMSGEIYYCDHVREFIIIGMPEHIHVHRT